MRFSQRMGIVPIKTALQVNDIDSELRNRLWNILNEDFFYQLGKMRTVGHQSERGEICRLVWIEFLNRPINEIPQEYKDIVDIDSFIKSLWHWFYYKAIWYDIYELIEYIGGMESKKVAYKLPQIKDVFLTKVNWALEKEMSGFRVVEGKVVKITSEEEIESIEAASANSNNAVATHIKAATGFLADRKNPNYRNSVKESISAVESLCKIITGDKNATLPEALKEIEKTHSLHPGFKKALSALYGYTSDAEGIRHALLDKENLNFEDAKYMLVICSAFINYLNAKVPNR